MKYDNGSACKVSVDGTDFRIHQLKLFNKMLYSHKFNGSGVQYEVAMSIQGGDIVQVERPFPCGAWLDIKIFRQNLKHALLPGEKVEADFGYQGKPAKVNLPEDNIFGSSAQKEAKSLVRSQHKTCKCRFKQWDSLSTVFRHAIEKHQIEFLSIAFLTQISLNYGTKLFMVDYKTKSIKDVMKCKKQMVESNQTSIDSNISTIKKMNICVIIIQFVVYFFYYHLSQAGVSPKLIK